MSVIGVLGCCGQGCTAGVRYPARAGGPSQLTEIKILKTKKTHRETRAFQKALASAPKEKYFLRLYVAGASARSRQALRRVYQLCEAELNNNYELEVIDVYQQPELARRNQIVATPTLVKELPTPVRRFVGALANTGSLFD